MIITRTLDYSIYPIVLISSFILGIISFKMLRESLSSTEQLGRLEADQYRRETGFPTRTAEVIRAHLQKVFSIATANTTVRIPFIGCDDFCSVGQGGNIAIPGSDVDGLSILFLPPITEDDIREFTRSVYDLVDPQLVNLSLEDLCGTFWFSTDWLESISKFGWDKVPQDIGHTILTQYCYQQIVHGTHLYGDESDIIAQLRSAPFALSTPKAQPVILDELPLRRKIKYSTRKTLKDSFLLMTPIQQYTVIRTMMQLKHEALTDPVDFSVNGKDANVLDSLLKLGLFNINDGFFQPLWVHGIGLRC